MRIPLILLSITLIAFVMAHRTSHPQAGSAQAQAPAVAYTPPTISFENRKPEGDKIDPALISHENQGNYLDLNGDGIPDHFIMNNDTLYYEKGLGNNQYAPAVPVLRIKGDVMAYCVQMETFNGKTQAVMRFWNPNRDGYLQRCLGLNPDGIPYFGEIESQ